MNSAIRQVGIGILVLFLGLVAQLTYLQMVRSAEACRTTRTTRACSCRTSPPARPDRHRRRHVSRQVEKPNDDLKHDPRYPPADRQLFAHVVGYQSVNLGNTGVEAEYNDQLAGRDFRITINNLSDFFSGKEPAATSCSA